MAIKKVLENNPPLKMTHFTKKKGILVSIMRRAVKIKDKKNFKIVRKPLSTVGIKQKQRNFSTSRPMGFES